MNDDVESDHLGDPYRARTIPLGGDEEGEAVATLVSRTDAPKTGKAAFYIHGFSDYFFHPHVADFFVDRGYAFYALDLRKAGRSLLPHQTAHYVRHIAQYFSDLDAAAEMIRTDGNTSILAYGHSTGGLTLALWAHRLQNRPWLAGLILNSPFFEFNIDARLRRLGIAPLDIAGLLAPRRAIPSGGGSINVEGMHRDFRGEWDFNLKWKPYEGTAVRLGWLRAVDRAQRRVRKGLNLSVPVLAMASTSSYTDSQWSEEADRSDTVLNADDIVRWAPQLGRDVSIVRVLDGRHDLALSKEPARKVFFAEIDAWMRSHAMLD